MRYLLQIVAMIVDLIVAGAVSWAIYDADYDPVMIGMAFCVVVFWSEGGGLMAWRPSNVRQFMKNAKKAGL